MGLLRRLLMVVLAGLLAGCGSGQEDDFLVQPEWERYLERIPADLDFKPAVTHWEHVRSLETNPNGCASPQKTTEAWAAFHDLVDPEEPDHLTIDIRTRQNQDNTATGLVQRWGLRDDALAGTDYQLTLKSINGCWQPTRWRFGITVGGGKPREISVFEAVTSNRHCTAKRLFMKAVVTSGWGWHPRLTLQEVPEPGEPGPDDVIVQVAASSVNPKDWKLNYTLVRLATPVLSQRLPPMFGDDAYQRSRTGRCRGRGA